MIRNWLHLVVVLFVLTYLNLYSQSTGDVVVLLQGKVFDNAGKPVKAKIIFTDSKGKTISTTSNSNDGFYQQILKPGTHYNVSFDGYMSVGISEVSIPNVKEYAEISSTFTIKKIEEGLELYEFSAFEPQDSVLAGEYLQTFSQMETFLKTNLNVNLVITISMKDSYFANKKVKVKYQDKKGKTKSKSVTLSPEQQSKQVLDARLRAVQDYLASLKIRSNKISYQLEEKLGQKPQNKKKTKKSKNSTPESQTQKVNNIKIVVGKIIKM